MDHEIVLIKLKDMKSHLAVSVKLRSVNPKRLAKQLMVQEFVSIGNYVVESSNVSSVMLGIQSNDQVREYQRLYGG